jgi:hypothetical protein
MSERLARIAESNSTVLLDKVVRVESGHGTLPSICPWCGGKLDFGKIGESELVCRDKCGWEFDR